MEYKVQAETVVLDDSGEVTVVPSPAGESATWVHAERLVENPYPDEDGPDLILAYEDRWYSGRDYQLFAKLAHVRNYAGEITPIDQPRGLPEDVSDDVASESESWGIDGHSHSWQTLEELLAVDWSDVYNQSPNVRFANLLARMQELASEKCEGRLSDVRITYWFDN